VTILAPRDSRIFTNTTSVFNDINISNDGGPYGSRVYFGTLDLVNNDLIVKPAIATESNALAMLAKITDQVRSGYNFGSWTGTGITSRSALADAEGIGTTSLGFSGSAITAVGVILNDDGSHTNPDGIGHPIWNTWASRPVDQYSVLVKYTFYGDTTLKGYVDDADLAKVAANLGTGTGWAHGDFRYIGSMVDGIDVTLAANSSCRGARTVDSHPESSCLGRAVRLRSTPKALRCGARPRAIQGGGQAHRNGLPLVNASFYRGRRDSSRWPGIR
jgi:hypothetical protein